MPSRRGQPCFVPRPSVKIVIGRLNKEKPTYRLRKAAHVGRRSLHVQVLNYVRLFYGVERVPSGLVQLDEGWIQVCGLLAAYPHRSLSTEALRAAVRLAAAIESIRATPLFWA